jgi:Na+/melibiose symporter-like transporter
MNQIFVRVAQAISVVGITAFFISVARAEVTQAYFGAALVMSVILTSLGSRFVSWLDRRWKGDAG